MASVDDSGQLGWVLGGVATIIATLAGVVSMLWKTNESKNAKAIEELKVDRDHLQAEADECRQDREDLRVEVAGIKQQLNQCSACVDCPTREPNK